MNTYPQCDLSIFRGVVTIERREAPARTEFEQSYLEAPGRPVILTDVTKSWQALSKWNFSFFNEKFGQEEVVVSDQLRRPKVSLRMKMSAFLSYCEHPRRLEKFGNPPLYLGFQPFGDHLELLEDFSHPSVASCVYDGLTGDLYKWYVEQFGVILIGSARTVTSLHADLYNAHGWLAQILGHKHWLIFSPEDTPNIYSGTVDLLNPDLKVYPNLRRATVYEGVVGPGEVMFVPNGWYHHVMSLDPSVSVGFNFVNRTNYLEHILGISRDLPNWAKRINSERFRDALSISWAPSDFIAMTPDKPSVRVSSGTTS